DVFGCVQHSFGRWLKRGLRGKFMVLMMLMLPACAIITEEDDLLFLKMFSLSTSEPRSSAAAPTPERIDRCSEGHGREETDYMNFSECTIAIMEHYLPSKITQRLSRTGPWSNPVWYGTYDVRGKGWGSELDGEGDAMAKFTRFQQFTNANCPRFIPMPVTIECVRPFRTSLRDLRGYMFRFSQPTGPCRQGMIRFSIDIPNAQELRVKQVRFDSVQPCS
ncbi:MAG: hypothetical protein ACKO51_16080, partial [Alphaproteobacteria bacterium]